MFYKKIAAVVMSVIIAGSVPCTVFADTELRLVEIQLGKDINVHDKQKFELEI